MKNLIIIAVAILAVGCNKKEMNNPTSVTVDNVNFDDDQVNGNAVITFDYNVKDLDGVELVVVQPKNKDGESNLCCDSEDRYLMDDNLDVNGSGQMGVPYNMIDPFDYRSFKVEITVYDNNKNRETFLIDLD